MTVTNVQPKRATADFIITSKTPTRSSQNPTRCFCCLSAFCTSSPQIPCPRFLQGKTFIHVSNVEPLNNTSFTSARDTAEFGSGSVTYRRTTQNRRERRQKIFNIRLQFKIHSRARSQIAADWFWNIDGE